LLTEKGRHVWVYDEGHQQTMADKYFLGLDVVRSLFVELGASFLSNLISRKSKEAPALDKPKTLEDSLKNALDFYSKLQLEDGHWGNDYGGPMFLLPGPPSCRPSHLCFYSR